MLTIDGQSVFSVESLKSGGADGSEVYLDVPAGLLRAGAYEIKLSRVSEESAERVATYYFRAQIGYFTPLFSLRSARYCVAARKPLHVRRFCALSISRLFPS